MTVPRVEVVAALILAPDPRTGPATYLVQQRLPNKSRPLLWEFPGGKVEAGETKEQALRRECREELDVELSVGRELWSTEHTYPDLTVALTLFLARIEEGTPKPLHAHALRFASPLEMRSLPFCEADLPLLDALAEGALRVNGEDR